MTAGVPPQQPVPSFPGPPFPVQPLAGPYQPQQGPQFAAPGYQGPPPAPKPPVVRAWVFAGSAWLVAGGLVAASLFLPVQQTSSGPEGRRTVGELFLWGQHVEINGRFLDSGPPVLYGIPWAIATVLLLAAAVVALSSARRPEATGSVLAARTLGTLGAGMLLMAAIHWMIVTTAFISNTDRLSTTRAPRSADYGAAYWLLIAASVVAVAGVVLSIVQRPTDRPRHQPPRWEPPTPRYGVPVQSQPVQSQPGQSQPDHTPPGDLRPPAEPPAEPAVDPAIDPDRKPGEQGS